MIEVRPSGMWSWVQAGPLKTEVHSVRQEEAVAAFQILRNPRHRAGASGLNTVHTCVVYKPKELPSLQQDAALTVILPYPESSVLEHECMCCRFFNASGVYSCVRLVS